jgi:hypothetical protein
MLKRVQRADQGPYRDEEPTASSWVFADAIKVWTPVFWNGEGDTMAWRYRIPTLRPMFNRLL